MKIVDVKIDFTKCNNTLDIMNAFNSSLGIKKYNFPSWDAMWSDLTNLDSSSSDLFKKNSDIPDIVNLVLYNYKKVKEVYGVLNSKEHNKDFDTLNSILVDITDEAVTYNANLPPVGVPYRVTFKVENLIYHNL